MPRLMRAPAAVQALEELQRSEYGLQGDALPDDGHRASLRDALRMERISSALDQGGLDAAIGAAGDDAEVEREVDRLAQTWRLDDPTQWSRYERPDQAVLIASLTDRLDHAVGLLGWTLTTPPAVGTLPTRQTGALAQESDGGPVVLVDSGFFRFATTVATLAVQTSWDLSTVGVIHEASFQLLTDLLVTHFAAGSLLLLNPRHMPEPFDGLVDALADGIALFVLGHEYAHVIAGDTESHPLTDDGRPPDDIESSADARGLQLALLGDQPRLAAQARGYPLSAALAHLAALGVMQAAADTYGLSEPGAHASGHPPPSRRFRRIHEAVQESSLVAELGDALAMGEQFSTALHTLWQELQPAFAVVAPLLRDHAFDGRTPGVYEVQALVAAAWAEVRADIGLPE